ncbi:MAG TPA: glycoside hydrolase family 16 protein, partial [Balneolales bacterium]|nr:glycoside hydrolase family 16 protein [Balneolales bacterium]
MKDGKLIITARKEKYNGEDYTSGRIRTRDHFAWKYGKFVARIKLPYGHGMWPAFWMLPAENKTGLGSRLSQTPEIDIMEMIGRNPATDYGTGHWWNHGAQMKGGHYTLKNGNLSDAYHTYSVTWGPKR